MSRDRTNLPDEFAPFQSAVVLRVYLNDTDGDTVVESQRTSPEDDKAIVFQGEHYHYTPSTERRIVLVATFI